jgi:hypothetical protein
MLRAVYGRDPADISLGPLRGSPLTENTLSPFSFFLTPARLDYTSGGLGLTSRCPFNHRRAFGFDLHQFAAVEPPWANTNSPAYPRSLGYVPIIRCLTANCVNSAVELSINSRRIAHL